MTSDEIDIKFKKQAKLNKTFEEALCYINKKLDQLEYTHLDSTEEVSRRVVALKAKVTALENT